MGDLKLGSADIVMLKCQLNYGQDSSATLRTTSYLIIPKCNTNKRNSLYFLFSTQTHFPPVVGSVIPLSFSCHNQVHSENEMKKH